MEQKLLDQLKTEIETLISDLGIQAKVEISVTSDNQESEIVGVQIESEQAAYLIGFHGETLQSLQLVISFLVHRTLGQWFRVLVNVGDYRQKREDQLAKLALNLAMKAKFSGEQQIIPNLTASERRIVHLALADRTDVYTESEGEGSQRQLTIKPRTPSS